MSRSWPPLVIGILVVGLVAFTWIGASDSSEQIRQSKVLQTAAIVGVGVLLVLFWVGLFSPFPRRTRSTVVAGVFVVVASFLALFRFRGVSGDLVPQFELRFRARSAELPDVNWESLPGALDYPQFLGTDRDARVGGIRIARDWTANPPQLLWRRPVGRGWSGFAVAGNAAVTQEQHSMEERVVRYELSTGKVNWATREVARYENVLAGEGPRATPTIHEGRVYAMGGTGLLTVLDLDSGELLWKRDVLRDNRDGDAKIPTWGKSDSPLVVDDLVIVSGGSGAGLIAYDLGDGDVVWRGRADGETYASPAIVTLAGERQIVSFSGTNVTASEPASGSVLWRHAWPGQSPKVAQPLPVPGDRLLVSAGYGAGARLLKVQREASGEFAVKLVWESLRLKSKFAHLIYFDGFIYGLDDGILVCLDPETGRRMWKRGRYGHGQLLLVDGLLLIQGEHGDIILVEPSPEELRELTRFQAMDAKIWNTPALAGRYLLIRNDAEAALFELPLASRAAATLW